MSLETTNLLLNFYQNIDVFLLIVIRILGFFIILPILTATSIPAISKIGFSLFIAHLVFASGVVGEIYYADSTAGYLFLMVKEFMVGFVLGYVVYIVFSVLYMAGQLIDYQIGFSMVNIFDPVSQIQVPIVGNLLYFVICAFAIQTGGFNSFISAIFYSYQVISPGQAVIVGNSFLYTEIIQIILYFVETGVRIAFPIMGSILVLDVAMGLMVKTVPQMNVFVVGVPIKLLVGLTILYLIMPIIVTVYDMIYNEAYRELLKMMRGLVT